jgi:hypothetical protein
MWDKEWMIRVTVRGMAVAVVICVFLGILIVALWTMSRPKNCLDFGSRQEAQAYYAGFDSMGPSLIDVDADGRACEELPNQSAALYRSERQIWRVQRANGWY